MRLNGKRQACAYLGVNPQSRRAWRAVKAACGAALWRLPGRRVWVAIRRRWTKLTAPGRWARFCMRWLSVRAERIEDAMSTLAVPKSPLMNVT